MPDTVHITKMGNYFTPSLYLRRLLARLTNGNEAQVRVRIGRNVNPGDTLTVDLHSIDEATYWYFHTLRDILSSDRSPTSLSPANPNTNLTNGSLGYFSAYAADSRMIILP